MSSCFFPFLAFEEFDNTAKYSLVRVLLEGPVGFWLRKEEERHIIKEEKSRNWGARPHIYCRNPKHRITIQGKGEEDLLPPSIPSGEAGDGKMS